MTWELVAVEMLFAKGGQLGSIATALLMTLLYVEFKKFKNYFWHHRHKKNGDVIIKKR
jgi:hypothetical protein